jgi:hypothetical protein
LKSHTGAHTLKPTNLFSPAKLITDLKRLQAQCAKYEPIIVEVRPNKNNKKIKNQVFFYKEKATDI